MPNPATRSAFIRLRLTFSRAAAGVNAIVRRTAPSALLSAVLLSGCQPEAQLTPARPTPPPQAASAEPEPAGETEAQPGPALATGPGELYLAVRGQGILRLRGSGFVPVLSTPGSLKELATAPDGSVVASYYAAGKQEKQQFPGGTVRIVGERTEKLSPLSYSQFTFREASPAAGGKAAPVPRPAELWATPDAFEWALHHYDGARWSVLRTREQFVGKFDDNKLNGFAVAGDSVWVSCWNGLFRQRGGEWQAAALPKAAATDQPPWQLLVSSGRLAARFFDGYFALDAASEGAAHGARDGDGWVRLGWPRDTMVSALSPLGHAVGYGADSKRLWVGTLDGDVHAAKVAVARAGNPRAAGVDTRGRAWLALDHALVVLSPEGRILAEFGPGTLGGVDGQIDGIAVPHGGPTQLPERQIPALREVTGRVVLHRSGKPLAGAEIVICNSVSGCKGAVWQRKTKTAADGSFRLKEVPLSELYLHISVPQGLADCATPFTETAPQRFTPRSHCPDGAPRDCQLGDLQACTPFELPPPR